MRPVFTNAVEVVRLLREGLLEAVQRGKEAFVDLDDGRQVHRGGDDVVARLSAIYVVVCVHGLIHAPGAAPKELVRAVRNHLIRVHVR